MQFKPLRDEDRGIIFQIHPWLKSEKSHFLALGNMLYMEPNYQLWIFGFPNFWCLNPGLPYARKSLHLWPTISALRIPRKDKQNFSLLDIVELTITFIRYFHFADILIKYLPFYCHHRLNALPFHLFSNKWWKSLLMTKSEHTENSEYCQFTSKFNM